jgi:hypothetical protein
MKFPKVLMPILICGALSASGQTYDGVAQLPLTVPEVRQSFTPSDNIPIFVSANVPSLQTVLNAAVPGDTIVIDPAFIATLSGLVLPNGTAQQWITIKTASALLPSENVRVSPAFAGIVSLPNRPVYAQPTGGAAKLMPTIILNGQNASLTGGSFVRLIGLEVTRTSGTGIVYNLYRNLGSTVIVDRCWFHGTATDETTRGIDLSNSPNSSVINSYFSDFHCRAISGSCGDAQAISGGLSTGSDGNYLIQNNFLEASGENFMLGGGPALYVTPDVTVQYNDIYKVPSWNPSDPSFDGGTAGKDGIKHPWVVKNHIEIKNATRVLIQGNRLQYNWAGFTQNGSGIVITPKNQASAVKTSVCPLCAVTNVTLRYNYSSYTGQALQLGCGPNTLGGWPAACGNIEAHDLWFDHLQYPYCNFCASFLVLIGGGSPAVPFNNVDINHSTFQNDGWLTPAVDKAATMANGILNLDSPVTGNAGMHFDYNQFDPGNQIFYPTGGGASDCWTQPGSFKTLLALCWPGGTFIGNQATPTLTINKTHLPYPDGNNTGLAGGDMTTINSALANRR